MNCKISEAILDVKEILGSLEYITKLKDDKELYNIRINIIKEKLNRIIENLYTLSNVD